MSELALFDFDGTLTRKDSLPDFLRHTFSKPRLVTGTLVLLPTLIRYVFGRMEGSAAKERVLRHFFRGKPASFLHQAGERYALEVLPLRLRPDAMRRLLWHREQQHEIAVVTASLEDWIRPWADKVGIEVIGTRMEIENDRLTGRFATPNCKGEEKVRRIVARYDLQQYSRIQAYGDTRDDRAMLEIANDPHWNAFRG